MHNLQCRIRESFTKPSNTATEWFITPSKYILIDCTIEIDQVHTASTKPVSIIIHPLDVSKTANCLLWDTVQGNTLESRLHTPILWNTQHMTELNKEYRMLHVSKCHSPGETKRHFSHFSPLLHCQWNFNMCSYNQTKYYTNSTVLIYQNINATLLVFKSSHPNIVIIIVTL